MAEDLGILVSGLLNSSSGSRIICEDDDFSVTVKDFVQIANGVSSKLNDCEYSPVIAITTTVPTCIIPALLVGILKAGRAFCCIDHAVNSDDRLLQSCFASLVITDNIECFNEENWLCEEWYLPFLNNVHLYLCRLQSCTPGSSSLEYLNICYVAFTSGSTGTPKPVFVTHKSLIPNIYDFNQLWNVSSSDIIALLSPLTFDPSMIEIFCALSSQAKIYVVNHQTKLDATELAVSLYNSRTSVIQITPSLFNTFSESDLELLLTSPQCCLRVIAFGGEHFPYESWDSIPEPLRNWMSKKEHRIFNLYGVTEVSCWASAAEIDCECLKTSSAFSDVGIALSDTSFLDVIPLVCCGSGKIKELAICSKNRHCYVGAEILSSKKSGAFVRRTGDLVIRARNGHFRLVGRVDNFTKRFGRKVNVRRLEDMVEKAFASKVSRAIAVFSKKDNRDLNLCIFLNNNFSDNFAVSDVRNLILSKLGQLYMPNYVHFTRQPVPLSNHGKASRKLTQSVIAKTAGDVVLSKKSLYEVISELWQEVTNRLPRPTSRFVEDGGNSIGVVRICERIHQAESEKHLPLLADLLLSKTFGDVVKYLEDQEVVAVEHHTCKASFPIENVYASLTTNLTCIGRAGCGFGPISYFPVNLEKRCDLSVSWKVYMEKCVDSSAVVKLGLSDLPEVFVSSHSGLICCLDTQTGQSKWSTHVEGRIEGSPALSACGNFIICGTFDNHICVLKVVDGTLYFKVHTGNIVKCTPSVDYGGTGLVYVGCHDGGLYVLGRKSVHKVDLNVGSIFASPLLFSEVVVICSLQGKVTGLTKVSLEVKWRFEGPAPIFATPVKISSDLFVTACVTGDVFALNANTGIVAWRIEKIGGNLFSPLAFFQPDSVLVATHSDKTGSVICLDCEKGTIRWTAKVEAPVTGAPFVINDLLAVIVDTKGKFYLLRTDNGKLMSLNFQLAGDVFASPVACNDQLYIGCRDDYFYCLKMVFT